MPAMPAIEDNLDIKFRLKKDGYERFKHIGHGTRGHVYLIQNAVGNAKSSKGHVLKVTDDVTEAQAMALMKKKPNKNVVKVYNVWAYRSIPRVYFIEQEKLDDIDKSSLEGYWNSSATEFPVFWEKIQGELISSTMTNKITVHDVIAGIFAQGTGGFGTEIAFASEESFSDKFSKFGIQMCQAAEHLARLNVKWEDFHPANVMQKGSTYKIIDLGYSKSGGKITDIREMKLGCVLERIKWQA